MPKTRPALSLAIAVASALALAPRTGASQSGSAARPRAPAAPSTVTIVHVIILYDSSGQPVGQPDPSRVRAAPQFFERATRITGVQSGQMNDYIHGHPVVPAGKVITLSSTLSPRALEAAIRRELAAVGLTRDVLIRPGPAPDVRPGPNDI